MKLYSLSEFPNAPCLVVKFKKLMIMLDCGLDWTTGYNYLPVTYLPNARLATLPAWTVPTQTEDTTGLTASDLKTLQKEIRECSGRWFVNGLPELHVPELGVIDLSLVDVILLSNFHSMMALPYITEYTDFKGEIYATEPTLQLGHLLMEDLADYCHRNSDIAQAEKWKSSAFLNLLPAPLRAIVDPGCFKKCYSSEDIKSCILKIQPCTYCQKLDIFGALQATAVSSGFMIGSCNWVIQSDFEKIVYMSGSSALTTHPSPLDLVLLKNSDVLIVTGLSQVPQNNPDIMIGEFCNTVATTVRAGGNVLVPVYSTGVIYDLLECLYNYMETVGLTHIPVFFVSPSAESSLAYSNIYAEWLCSAKQSKIYIPEPPFIHDDMIKKTRLKTYPFLHGKFSSHFKTPCVVFCGHPHLRYGDSVHFMELWGGSALNTVAFVEPDVNYLEALACYQPLAMKVSYCPIDTRLTHHDANKLIKNLKPLNVVIPQSYTSPPPSLPTQTDLVIEANPSPFTYQRASVLSLPVRRMYEKIELSPELADKLSPVEVKTDVALCGVTGVLSMKDNKNILVPATQVNQEPTQTGRKRKHPSNIDPIDEVPPVKYAWGSVNIHDFVRNLSDVNITDVKVEDLPTGHIVILQSEDTIIQIEENSTHILGQGNEVLRKNIRDALLTCLYPL